MGNDIPFIDLKTQFSNVETAVRSRMDAVLAHGCYIMGPEVAELEKKLSTYSGSKNCVTVASGTEGLLISLMALGVGPGDEVITTPFTFIATVEVIVLLGAKPVFVDVEKDTCNIDANLVEESITSVTKAIIPVSLYGQCSDMDEINEIGRKYEITVIEDGAQSFGALYKGKKSCNLSRIGCTSFFPSKPLGCYGDGGALFTDDDELALVFRQIRVHGQSERYVHARIGVGGRMDTLQCAIVLAKLEVFEKEIEQRLSIGESYNELFDSHDIARVAQKSDRTSVFAQYTIFVDDRDILRKNLAEAKIPTAVHYPIPINEQKAYKNLCSSNVTPIASEIARKVVSLPMSPYLSRVDQGRIVDKVVKFSP